MVYFAASVLICEGFFLLLYHCLINDGANDVFNKTV